MTAQCFTCALPVVWDEVRVALTRAKERPLPRDAATAVCRRAVVAHLKARRSRCNLRLVLSLIGELKVKAGTPRRCSRSTDMSGRGSCRVVGPLSQSAARKILLPATHNGTSRERSAAKSGAFGEGAGPNPGRPMPPAAKIRRLCVGLLAVTSP